MVAVGVVSVVVVVVVVVGVVSVVAVVVVAVGELVVELMAKRRMFWQLWHWL